MWILAERGNTFWRLRPLRPPWGHLGSPCLPECLPDASQMSPRCLQMLPDASQMPPDASQMPPRCLPDASRCFQMPPRCIQMPPPWCLPNDASPMMLAAWCLLYVFLKNICLGSYVGSFASVTKKAITLHRTRISDTLRTHCYSYAFSVLIHWC